MEDMGEAAGSACFCGVRWNSGVRSLCVLGRGASQLADTGHSVGRGETHCQQACPRLEGPRERWEQDPSSQPARKAGCVSKAAFRRGSVRRMERSSSYSWWLRTQKRGQPLWL